MHKNDSKKPKLECYQFCLNVLKKTRSENTLIPFQIEINGKEPLFQVEINPTLRKGLTISDCS